MAQGLQLLRRVAPLAPADGDADSVPDRDAEPDAGASPRLVADADELAVAAGPDGSSDGDG